MKFRGGEIGDLIAYLQSLKTELENLTADNLIKTEIRSVSIECTANTTSGKYDTPTPPDGYKIVSAYATNTGSGSCTFATCKIQSDGRVYIAMKNWTGNKVTIPIEYTAVYFKE